ncbi:ATP-binding cassette domain-containing protein [Anaerorhabdus furcosa]|uniref:ABC-2 type transport system ATP-binding protein n=1 Tax=Anaerorhabdus furcosa TaxID=118967 RepID=A0A1T4QB88_9FIRM|nr:ABC transporter ATP-binding protein [Anaerorhabdus furcosa]SKA00934.1 ABC-2 type transport system ATP-binding protein [Anaerorhabdus furcosa]
MLEVKHLSKSFEDQLVLNDCNFVVKDSTIVGLVGSNGAGKSTLLKCIQGIYDFDGEIAFDGELVKENNKAKAKIFMISDTQWFPMNATIESMKNFYKSIYIFDNELFEHYVKTFKLDTTKKINELSKGTIRLVSIAYALAIQPKLLLIDEVFDGLDPKIRKIFKDCLIKEMDELEMSVIVSSHALRELEDICDEFIFLDKTIYTQGSVQDLKQNYCKLQVISDDMDNIKLILKEENILSFKSFGKVSVIVSKYNKNQVIEMMEELKPLFYECLSISFEEYYMLIEKEEDNDK